MRLTLFCTFFLLTVAEINNEEELKEFLKASPLNALLLVEKEECSTDEKCREEREQIEQIRQICVNERIALETSNNAKLAEKQLNLYGPWPKLAFYRDGFPLIFPGSLNNVDSLQEWFVESRERLTSQLNDETFEHDTQAATGSTTGDWFVLFKKSNESRSLLPVWESTSLHFRNRVIFAYVDLDVNPKIQERFHLYNLPSFVLFKRGKMYRYENPSWKQTAFVDFIERGFERVKGEIVPPEPSVFSTSFQKFPFYFVVIPMVLLVVVLLVLISGINKKKTIDERPTFQVKID